jgi:hypothetical protein
MARGVAITSDRLPANITFNKRSVVATAMLSTSAENI